jgi:hypothetical protein
MGMKFSRVIKSRIREVEHIACMRHEKLTQKFLSGSLKGRDHLGDPRYRWDVYIKVNLKKIKDEVQS